MSTKSIRNLIILLWMMHSVNLFAQSTGVTAIKAGKLLDPETGTLSSNQIILIEKEKFTAIGPNVSIPKGARVIDLSGMTVMPGLVDAHNHLALTYKIDPERNLYYFTYITESTALRAIQAASNGMQMLASGFTIVRDMGNNGNYADVALRQAIEQGWIPGPMIINSGIIIGGMGGQFWPTPEMGEKNMVYPEYLDADTPDEIVKAIHQNMLYGARVIKICVDCKPWGYSVDDIKLVIAESAKAGFRVEGHCQTVDGARRAIEAGIWSIAHDSGMTDELHKEMARKGIWRAGTETPITLPEHTTPERYAQTVTMLKNAYDNKVPLTFSTDADYYVPGKTRGEVAIEFIETWKAAKVPNVDIIRAMTINGYKCSETEKTRGPIKVGLAADLIAVKGNPVEQIDVLRNVDFVMKDGEVFKQNGVMTPEKFLHGGPVKGVRLKGN
ncbi:MAG: amidohydrolase family protein [Bacteroidetes bacterium]|nr:amidohydrolase family protein [Bacteroidota bacterium]